MKPTVGRIVLVTRYEGDGGPPPPAEAGIIVAVHSDTCVDVHVFGAAARVETSAAFDEGQIIAGAGWRWPPRAA